MKHFASFTVLLALLGIFGMACGSSHPNPLGGTGGSDVTAGPGPSTSVGSNTTGSNSTGSNSTGSNTTTTTGGGCKAGGTGCQAFSECCSGTCANQVCTTCGGEGEFCDQGCCQGLTCYNNTCGTCRGPSSSCTLASDCCSNICTQGTCGSCKSDGSSCGSNQDCCGGVCSNGVCGCNGPTCLSVLQGTGDPSALCGAAADAYDAFAACICMGACQGACADTACQGITASDACNACVPDIAMGCGTEMNDCTNN
jgi:hypothetical protein